MSEHVFEPELDSPVPRRVGYRDGVATGCGLWFVRLFILPHTIVGVSLLCIAIGSTGLFAAVGLFGGTYDGKVVRKEIRRYKSGQTHHLHYVFVVDDREYTGEASVSQQRFGEINEGGAITVRALESAPSWGEWPRVPGHSPLLDLGGIWLFALFWNGILSIFVWTVYLRPWRNRCLVRYGQPTQGIIREVKAQSGKGSTRYRITYEYAVPSLDGTDGQVHSGKTSTTRKEGAYASVGNLVTVLYDPRKPWRSVIYKYCEYRVK
jgi:hypothetical protein